MQIDYIKISCKEDVHICCTNFAKEMEWNSHERTSRWKMYGKRLFLRTLKFEMHYKDSTLINGTNKPPNGPNPNRNMQFIKFIYYNDKFSLYKITFKTNKYQLLLDIVSIKMTTYIPSTKFIHDTFKIPKLNIKSYLSNNSKPWEYYFKVRIRHSF